MGEIFTLSPELTNNCSHNKEGEVILSNSDEFFELWATGWDKFIEIAKNNNLLDKIITEQNPDAILLGPQVKYLYDKVVDRYGHLGKPIFVIDTEEYGNMDGERVLKRAILEIKKKKAESEGK